MAVIDRVNTTFGTWMGTTIGCAQCHNHKYDPLSQEDFFRLYAVFNNTADADRGDDTPVLEFFTATQEAERARIMASMAAAESVLATDTPAIAAAAAAWDATFPRAHRLDDTSADGGLGGVFPSGGIRARSRHARRRRDDPLPVRRAAGGVADRASAGGGVRRGGVGLSGRRLPAGGGVGARRQSRRHRHLGPARAG